jgi:hypothetical protein
MSSLCLAMNDPSKDGDYSVGSVIGGVFFAGETIVISAGPSVLPTTLAFAIDLYGPTTIHVKQNVNTTITQPIPAAGYYQLEWYAYQFSEFPAGNANYSVSCTAAP